MHEPKFVPPPERTVQILDNHPFGLRRILFMEEEGNGALRTFLASHHFEAVFVKSAMQGFQELQARDFDVIVCNMTNAIFAGEMFFKAIERTKPLLCRRFVFMTDHSNDAAVDAFIRRVNGVKLWRPFEFHVLLETMQLVLRKTFQPTAPNDRAALIREADTDSACPSPDILRLTRLIFTSARQSIQFACLNFSPDAALIEELVLAARNKVRVEILVQDKTPGQIRGAIPPGMQSEMLEAGIILLEGRLAMEASRFIVIDDHWACASHCPLAPESLNVYHGEAAGPWKEKFRRFRASARQIIEVEADPSSRVTVVSAQMRDQWRDRLSALGSNLKVCFGLTS